MESAGGQVPSEIVNAEQESLLIGQKLARATAVLSKRSAAAAELPRAQPRVA